MPLLHATVTRAPSVIVADTVDSFTAAANEGVVLAYAPADSDTEAPDEPWFERRPGDAVSRTLLGPGFIWARIVRVDRAAEGSREFASIELPIAAW